MTGPEDVALLTCEVFSAYADLVPEPSSLRESPADVDRDLVEHGGLVARDATGRLVGAARFAGDPDAFWLRRLAVDPRSRGRGVGLALLGAAERVARSWGHDRVRVGVRRPLTDVEDFWVRRGFHRCAERGYWVELERRLAVETTLATDADTEALGWRLAGLLRAGDLMVLDGGLGAGKTTLVRGLGVGLGVRGAVTSPTFVISRVHPSTGSGPALVHVDAYRLGAVVEVDDLDLDASLADSVTVVEWGEGKVEGLTQSRLDVVLHRGSDPSDEVRTAWLRPVGPRWAGVDLRVLTSTDTS